MEGNRGNRNKTTFQSSLAVSLRRLEDSNTLRIVDICGPKVNTDPLSIYDNVLQLSSGVQMTV